MNITFDSVTLGEGLGADLPPVTLTVGPGEPFVVAVESDERPLLVSMLLGARLRPDAGSILVDGTPDLDALRAQTALVDTPFVVEPPAGVSLASAVAEELSFSGRPSSRRAIAAFLDEHGLRDYAKLPIRILPAVDRVRLFAELALLRPGVRALILTSPERHGAAPDGWYPALADIASRGVTVVIVTDVATSDILIRLGAHDATAILES
jgi:ABC-2 type transport system ATP-binding protein